MKKRLLALLICILMTCCVVFTAVIITSAADSEIRHGDFNSDEKVDINDLIYLRQYFADYDYDTETAPFDIPEGADTNGDNEITLKDIFFLRKFFAEVAITEQPNAINKYTVTATGDVSYAWHLWADGEIGEAVEGANTAALTGATNGLSYVCVVSYGELSRVSDPVIYMSHPICGADCECEDETHEDITWTPILTLADLKAAMENGGSYYLAEDITVDKAVSVKADTKLCLNGKKLTRIAEGDFSILSVTEDATLTLTDCSDEERVGYIDPESGLWTEGVYSGEGSATAYNLYGGVITGGNSAHGGAIYVKGSLELYGVNIAGNSANKNGGAIYLNGGSMIAKGDNVFVGNTAVNHAGAIYVTYVKDVSNGILTMNGGVFAHNTAMAGGAVSIRSNCEATFTSTEFIGNSVAGDDGNDETVNGDAEGGGAIYVGYGALTLNNATLTGNTAEMFGGAISAVKANVTVEGGELKENTAVRGGAINLINDCTASFTGTKFTSNSATGEANYEGGGAINAEEGILTLSGVIMDGNASAYYGGAINARKGEVIIKDDTVITNSEGTTGAALYFREAGTKVTITDVTVSNTNAKYNGAIYMTSAGELTVDGLVAEGNVANQGGVFYVSGGTITLNNVTASGNTAESNGGVIYVGGAVVKIDGSAFDGNTAKLGGAIYTASGKTTVERTDILNNTAENGGAAYAKGGELTLGAGTVAEGNIASENGGAIFVDESVTVAVNGASLTSNEALKGGAIFATKNAKLTVLGASFTENSANFGGAIYVEGATVEIGSDEQGNKTLFDGNTANKYYGGAIYINDYSFTPDATEEEPDPETEIVKSTVTVNGAIFKSNTAQQGGAVYVSKNEYTINNAEFINNSATSETYGGGAIYSTNSVGILDAVTFVGNTSHKGGAVALHSTSKMTVTSMTATGNSATRNSVPDLGVGGVFYVNNSTLNLIAGEGKTITFGSSLAEDANTAYDGGAINLENGAILNVSNVTFEGNSASNHGGAIYSKASVVTVTGNNTLFKNNSAAAHGGAIYATYSGSVHSVIEMTGGRFEGNTAMAGGAISSRTGCTVTFTGTVFVGNKAESKANDQGGGAIYTNNNTLTLSGVTLDGNSSAYYGGAIAGLGATIVIKDNSIIKNSTGATGGAIQLRNGGSCTITDLTLTDNTASGSGVIYATGKNTALTVNGCIAKGNTATNGGIFYVSTSGVMNLTDVKITDNDGNNVSNMLYAGGSATVTINYRTEEEKNIWTGATKINDATVTYVPVSEN